MSRSGNPPERYGAVAIALHWGIGLALLGQIAFGFLLDDLAPRGTPGRSFVINLHKSSGLILGALIVLRLAWRWRHPPPPWPAEFPLAQARLAALGHRALYACMIVAPLAGYIASNVSRHGVRFFGIVLPPWGPDDPGLYAFFNGVHVAAGILLAVLIAGHVVIAIAHRRRDGGVLFARMWIARRRAARRASP